MTVGGWLRERTPTAPAHLLASIEHALGTRGELDARETPELCLDAAEELLGALLSRSTLGRESALDLLTVDALVTYAFEAAAASPETLAARADATMARFGRYDTH